MGGSPAPTPDPSTWTFPRLHVTREGEWIHDDEEVTHPGILANLRDSLRVDAQGYYMQIGSARVPVEVDDAPFVVIRVEPEGDRLVLTLNDLTREVLAVETLSLGADGIPRCRVKAGQFPARLNRAAAYQLLQRVQTDEAGGVATLVIGTTRRTIPMPPAPSGTP
jgi:uncharacterized protein